MKEAWEKYLIVVREGLLRKLNQNNYSGVRYTREDIQDYEVRDEINNTSLYDLMEGIAYYES